MRLYSGEVRLLSVANLSELANLDISIEATLAMQTQLKCVVVMEWYTGCRPPSCRFVSIPSLRKAPSSKTT